MNLYPTKNPEDVKKIHDFYNTNEKEIQEKINILKEWLKQQPHLPQGQDDQFLGNILLNNKFRIEQVKIKLDNYYTMKGQYKQYYEEDYSKFVPSKEILQLLSLPKLLPQDQTRLCIFRYKKDSKLLNLSHTIKHIILQMEFNQKYDYAMGERCIFDYENFTVDHLKNLNLSDINNAFKLYQEAYSGRVLSIDFFNAPSILSATLNILRVVLPTKLYNRIRVFKNKEELLEVYPKECLPKDYGGDLPSYDEMIEKWDQIYAEQQEFFTKMAKTTSNEKLRVGPVKNNENFGVDGTFKKLSLD